MPEIGTSGSMSGDGKRSVGYRPQATSPILDSTIVTISRAAAACQLTGDKQTSKGIRVGAEGGGLFESIEVNRQTQMEPASTSDQ